MEIKRYINFAIVSVIVLASCSKNEDIQITTDMQEDNGFKKFASVIISNSEGSSNSIQESRTSASINQNNKPTSTYHLKYVNLLAAEVIDKLNVENPPTKYKFNEKGAKFTTHYFTNSEGNANYDIYFKIKEEINNEGASNSGIITLSSDNQNENLDDIDIRLTTFKNDVLQNLQVDDMIYGINNFYFGSTGTPNENGIGSILFYLTYNPHDGLLSLPKIEDTNLINILADKEGKYTSIYNEYNDELFLSEELLIAATDENVYLFKTLKGVLNEGYKLLRKYNRAKTQIDKMKIDMERLTSIVNASFLIEDTYNEDTNKDDSYFDPNNIAESLKKFEERYKISLSDMMCPYATIDGVASEYNINNTDETNTSGACRMVLWAEDMFVIRPDNGKKDYKEPTIGAVSMKEGGKIYWGYGAQGNSYSVIFKGKVIDDNLLKFYVSNIGGKNIIISTKLKNLELLQNCAHHLTLLVKADDLAKFINSENTSRANSNDFVEFRVPSENLIIN